MQTNEGPGALVSVPQCDCTHWCHSPAAWRGVMRALDALMPEPLALPSAGGSGLGGGRGVRTLAQRDVHAPAREHGGREFVWGPP